MILCLLYQPEGEDQKSSKSLRQIADRDAWAASYAQYAGVVCCSHPEKAVTLWGHLAVVMSCQNGTISGWWKTYDETLRHSYILLYGRGDFYPESVPVHSGHGGEF